jgi:hypothetical protein
MTINLTTEQANSLYNLLVQEGYVHLWLTSKPLVADTEIGCDGESKVLDVLLLECGNYLNVLSEHVNHVLSQCCIWLGNENTDYYSSGADFIREIGENGGIHRWYKNHCMRYAIVNYYSKFDVSCVNSVYISRSPHGSDHTEEVFTTDWWTQDKILRIPFKDEVFSVSFEEIDGFARVFIDDEDDGVDTVISKLSSLPTQIVSVDAIIPLLTELHKHPNPALRIIHSSAD